MVFPAKMEERPRETQALAAVGVHLASKDNTVRFSSLVWSTAIIA